MIVNEYNFLMAIIIVISYLLGSIPTAYVIGKIKGINIFEIGSGNMGATNVIRSLGLKWGLSVMAFDILKGTVALLIALQIKPGSNASAMTVAAIAVIIGHNWSLFASLLTGRIRGGKGAATLLGTLLLILPIYAVIISLAIGIGIVILTRYVSLGVLIACFLMLIWLGVMIIQQDRESTFMIFTIVAGLLLLLRFRDNIDRLSHGTERRYGESA